jgi:hypothetical protein
LMEFYVMELYLECYFMECYFLEMLSTMHSQALVAMAPT